MLPACPSPTADSPRHRTQVHARASQHMRSAHLSPVPYLHHPHSIHGFIPCLSSHHVALSLWDCLMYDDVLPRRALHALAINTILFFGKEATPYFRAYFLKRFFRPYMTKSIRAKSRSRTKFFMSIPCSFITSTPAPCSSRSRADEVRHAPPHSSPRHSATRRTREQRP